MTSRNVAGGHVRAVERAMLLLSALAETPEGQTLQHLSQRAQCSPSTASRILATMLRHAIVDQDPTTRRYTLGSQLVAMAEVRSRRVDLRSVAAPYLRALRDATGETVGLNARSGVEGVCLDTIEGPQELRYVSEIGRRYPLSGLGASARVFLAHVDHEVAEQVLAQIEAERGTEFVERLRTDLVEVKRLGYTSTSSERVPGITSVAAPIFDGSGTVVAAIAVAGFADRWTPERLRAARLELLEATRTISAALGYRPSLNAGERPISLRS